MERDLQMQEFTVQILLLLNLLLNFKNGKICPVFHLCLGFFMFVLCAHPTEAK